jgi:hypothetical protein
MFYAMLCNVPLWSRKTAFLEIMVTSDAPHARRCWPLSPALQPLSALPSHDIRCDVLCSQFRDIVCSIFVYRLHPRLDYIQRTHKSRVCNYNTVDLGS